MTEGLFNSYKDGMKKLNDPVDDEFILRNHLEFKGKIESKIDEKLKNWLDVGRTKDYKVKLLETLEKDYKERVKANWNACEKGCASEYTRLFEPLYELPEMKSIDLVADSYFKEKKNDFIKKIQTFLDNCKAPRKCNPIPYLRFLLDRKVPQNIRLFLVIAGKGKGDLQQ